MVTMYVYMYTYDELLNYSNIFVCSYIWKNGWSKDEEIWNTLELYELGEKGTLCLEFLNY